MFEMLTTTMMMMSKTFIKANAIQKFISMCACVYTQESFVAKNHIEKKIQKKIDLKYKCKLSINRNYLLYRYLYKYI